MMIRKVALVLVRAFFATVPAVQPSFVCIILTVSLATQLTRSPFTHKLENWIENFSLIDHVFVVLLGIVFLELSDPDTHVASADEYSDIGHLSSGLENDSDESLNDRPKLQQALIYATISAVLLGLVINVAAIFWNVLVVSETFCPRFVARLGAPTIMLRERLEPLNAHARELLHHRDSRSSTSHRQSHSRRHSTHSRRTVASSSRRKAAHGTRHTAFGAHARGPLEAGAALPPGAGLPAGAPLPLHGTDAEASASMSEITLDSSGTRGSLSTMSLSSMSLSTSGTTPLPEGKAAKDDVDPLVEAAATVRRVLGQKLLSVMRPRLELMPKGALNHLIKTLKMLEEFTDPFGSAVMPASGVDGVQLCRFLAGAPSWQRHALLELLCDQRAFLAEVQPMWASNAASLKRLSLKDMSSYLNSRPDSPDGTSGGQADGGDGMYGGAGIGPGDAAGQLGMMAEESMAREASMGSGPEQLRALRGGMYDLLSQQSEELAGLSLAELHDLQREIATPAPTSTVRPERSSLGSGAKGLLNERVSRRRTERRSAEKTDEGKAEGARAGEEARNARRRERKNSLFAANDHRDTYGDKERAPSMRRKPVTAAARRERATTGGARRRRRRATSSRSSRASPPAIERAPEPAATPARRRQWARWSTRGWPSQGSSRCESSSLAAVRGRRSSGPTAAALDGACWPRCAWAAAARPARSVSSSRRRGGRRPAASRRRRRRSAASSWRSWRR